LTGVNFEALRPEDIAELQATDDFRNFQHLTRTRAQSIDPDDDPDTFGARLKFVAGQIIDAWQDTGHDHSFGMYYLNKVWSCLGKP
jgi:hypothetical protein